MKAEKPYYWEARKAWYLKGTTKDGKRTQTRLGDTKKEAYEAWRMLVDESTAVETTPTTSSIPSDKNPLFASLIEVWLKLQLKRLDRGEVSKVWLDRATNITIQFLNAHAKHQTSQIEPWVVEEWLGKRGWKANTERTLLITLKLICRWAAKTKRISESPLENMTMPSATRAEGYVTRELHEKLVAKIGKLRRQRTFVPILVMLWHTGCRPSEICNLTKEKLSNDFASFVLTKHKTQRKTQKARTIYLSPCAQTLSRIMAHHRDGHLLLNGVQQPWTRNAIRIRMNKLCKELKFKDIVAYSYRHGFTTNALTAGVNIATVAELLGHQSTEMISRYYGHLASEQDYLKSAVNRVTKNNYADLKPRLDNSGN